MYENEDTLLCHNADAIAAIIGNERTIRLGHATKWATVYVPTTRPIPREHIIVRTIGPLWASILQDAYGGESISVPKCERYALYQRNCKIKAQHKAGKSTEELASVYAVSKTTILRVLRSHRKVRTRKDRVKPLGTLQRGALRVGSASQNTASFQPPNGPPTNSKNEST